MSRSSARGRLRRFLGVALGGGRGKNTAVARLELDGGSDPRLCVVEAKQRYGQRGTGKPAHEPQSEALFRDDVLCDYLAKWTDDVTVVAIDAPLTLPPCIRCQLPCPGVAACGVPIVQWMRTHAPALAPHRRTDPGKPHVTPYTQRAAGLLLQAVSLHPRETLGQGMGPLAARAAHLRRRLSPRLRLHENLIEIHPRATLIRLFGAEQERRTRQGDTLGVWEARKDVLHRLTERITFDCVWPEVVVRSAPVFDAVVSGFTAFLWAREGWRGPRDLLRAGGAQEDAVRDAVEALGEMWLEDGWIWAPPLRERDLT